MASLESVTGGINSVTSAVNGIAGTLDSIFGWSAKRQERAQKRMMEQQQNNWKEQQQILAQQQLDQWNRENEYNDPTNYLKRLLEGASNNGISKAGILGNSPGGSVGQSATGVSVPGSTSSGLGSVSPLGIGSVDSLSNLKQRAEIGVLEAQKDNLNSQSAVNRSQTLLNQELATTQGSLRALYDDQKLDGKYRRAAMRAAADLDVANSDRIRQLTPAELDNLVASAAKSFEDAAFTAKQRGRYDEVVDMQLAQSVSIIALQVAQEEAFRELSRERKLNNDHFEDIVDDLAREAAANADLARSNANMASFDESHQSGNMWWHRVATALNTGTNMYTSYKSAKHGSQSLSLQRDALNQKNSYKREIVRRYKVNAKTGEMIPTSVTETEK